MKKPMKKTILILALLAVVTVALGLPAAIGWFVHDRLSESLAENRPEATIDWDRGWFRSGLVIEEPDLRARLDFRHAPISPPGWIALDGLVTLKAPVAAIDLTARLAYDGSLSANAKAPALDVPGPVSWQYQDPRLRLVRRRDGGFELNGSAQRLLIVDGIGNRLTFAEPELKVRSTPVSEDTASARLMLETRRLGQAQSRLAVKLDSIERAAFAELVDGLRQLAAAEFDSAAAGFGAIGAASAWQQMAAAGLQIEIEELVLDGQLSLSGQWRPGGNKFRLTGKGARATAQAWWSSVVGLAEQLPPEQARDAARRGLQELADQGLVELGRRELKVELQALP